MKPWAAINVNLGNLNNIAKISIGEVCRKSLVKIGKIANFSKSQSADISFVSIVFRRCYVRRC